MFYEDPASQIGSREDPTRKDPCELAGNVTRLRESFAVASVGA